MRDRTTAGERHNRPAAEEFHAVTLSDPHGAFVGVVRAGEVAASLG